MLFVNFSTTFEGKNKNQLGKNSIWQKPRGNMDKLNLRQAFLARIQGAQG